MPSALLFVILGVMWAVVLVPMWLRKHDEANESRSVDRFSRALRSLSSRPDKGERDADQNDTVVVARGAVPAPRAVLMPGRPRGAQDVQVTVPGPRAAARTRRATTPAMRRRRLVLGLAVLTVLATAAGLLHYLPVWSGAVPAVLLLGLLVHGRRQARRRVEMARRRQRREALSAAARAAERQHAPAARRGQRVVADAVAPAPPTVADPVVAETEVAADHWHAVPTTLPTYVTAPAATRVPRVIDRATPGGLSGAAMVDQARRTRQVEPAGESGMLVESFEISVPRGPSAKEVFAEQYVDARAGMDELEATDDESAIAALVEDPRTGADGRGYRRAAG